MPTETTTAAEQMATAKPAMSQGAVAVFKAPRLPYHPAIAERYNIDRAAWIALIDAVFPLAQSIDSVIMALSYCRARNLDPFKRPVHIVPVWNSAANRMVDTVWPGIGELRTTAFRTKTYAGCDECRFGPDQTRAFDGMAGKRGSERQVHADVTFPEFAQLTVYRMIDGQRVAVQGPRVYWMETYAAQGRSSVPNEMWQKRPRGQLEKCAEAAALRRAFPEELGEIYAAEEMEGKTIQGGILEAAAPPIEPQSTASQLDDFAAPAAESAGPVAEHDPETGEIAEPLPPSLFTVWPVYKDDGSTDYAAMLALFKGSVSKADTLEILDEVTNDNWGDGRLLTALSEAPNKATYKKVVEFVNARKSEIMAAGGGAA